ncbi:hypothetical protein COLO4_37820 [Corchorus olitorius]|uniref:Uncharacterized protein n=1 Tax=Corchorus olitorius TaxID=93759 RepID=A0A1R3FZ43_9ROSI|nr:hypothetical protein COLO4_37820 [Corchorus olitorius]
MGRACEVAELALVSWHRNSVAQDELTTMINAVECLLRMQ